MTRRVEILPLESGYVVKAWAVTEAEAFALQSALVSVPKAAAFVPALDKGPAFDSPEGLDAAHECRDRVVSEQIRPFYAALGLKPPPYGRQPPPCDGPPSGYAEPTAGEVLAQAAHEAAEGGEGCTSTVCAMTRGSGD